MKYKIKQTILIAILIPLTMLLLNNYYQIFMAAKHHWASYTADITHITLELASTSILLISCVAALYIGERK